MSLEEINEHSSGKKSNNVLNNLFFFKSNVSKLNYKGNFLFSDVVEKDVKLHINEVANFKCGKLYELKLDSIEDMPNECVIVCQDKEIYSK